MNRSEYINGKERIKIPSDEEVDAWWDTLNEEEKDEALRVFDKGMGHQWVVDPKAALLMHGKYPRAPKAPDNTIAGVYKKTFWRRLKNKRLLWAVKWGKMINRVMWKFGWKKKDKYDSMEDYWPLTTAMRRMVVRRSLNHPRTAYGGHTSLGPRVENREAWNGAVEEAIEVGEGDWSHDE